MLLIAFLVAANLLVAGLAVVGIRKASRNSSGYIAGLLALVVLPLANASFVWWLLSGIPYFPILTPAGVSMITLSITALFGALYAVIFALRKYPDGA